MRSMMRRYGVLAGLGLSVLLAEPTSCGHEDHVGPVLSTVKTPIIPSKTPIIRSLTDMFPPEYGRRPAGPLVPPISRSMRAKIPPSPPNTTKDDHPNPEETPTPARGELRPLHNPEEAGSQEASRVA